jgi:hypothetical protein
MPRENAKNKLSSSATRALAYAGRKRDKGVFTGGAHKGDHRVNNEDFERAK